MRAANLFRIYSFLGMKKAGFLLVRAMLGPHSYGLLHDFVVDFHTPPERCWRRLLPTAPRRLLQPVSAKEQFEAFQGLPLARRVAAACLLSDRDHHLECADRQAGMPVHDSAHIPREPVQVTRQRPARAVCLAETLEWHGVARV